MPPLLCPSPVLIDQSFPRNDADLGLVGKALGTIQEFLQESRVNVVLTPTLQMFVEDFQWQRTGPYPLLLDIYNLLVQWFLQPHEGLLILDLAEGPNCGLHPIPRDCEEVGLVQLWAEELAKLAFIHDQIEEKDKSHIGVACHKAFGGETLGTYKTTQNARYFPLIGPQELSQLADAFEWSIPSDLHLRRVSFAAAKHNVFALGASSVDAVTGGGSHYKVTFPGGNRPWILDRNEDPVNDSFIKELVSIVFLPFEVIKTTLLDGAVPEKRLKLGKSLPQRCIKFGV